MNRREMFRKGLNPVYIEKYDKLCSLLDEKWQPVSGFRSFERQAAIYEQGRTTPGKIVTNARPGESAHNYGCASDWTVFKFINGKEVVTWPDPRDPIWGEYGAAIEAAGLKWGKSFNDYPHNELIIPYSWGKLKSYHEKGSHERVVKALSLVLVKEEKKEMNEQQVKKPYLSRTIIVNTLLGVISAVSLFVPAAAPVAEFIKSHAAEIGMVWGILNIILRAITKDKIQLQD